MKEGGGGGEGRKRLQTNPSIFKTCVRQRTQRLIGSASRAILTWQDKWAVFKIEGFVCKHFLPFFPTPSPLFYLRHFSRGLFDFARSLLLNRTETLATQASQLVYAPWRQPAPRKCCLETEKCTYWDETSDWMTLRWLDPVFFLGGGTILLWSSLVSPPLLLS